jgi:hypothetical protein
MSHYDLVTAGELVRSDPDLMRLLSAASGYTSIMGRRHHHVGAVDELEALDRLAISGADAAAMDPAALSQIIAQKIAQGSVLTRVDKPTQARDYPLGFQSTAPVAAGSPGTAVSFPQIVFRGERLIVPSDIAGQFVLTQIIVGKNPQQVSADAIPCRVFDERGVGVRLAMDTAQISQQITLNVINIGGAPATFRAAIIGKAVE